MKIYEISKTDFYWLEEAPRAGGFQIFGRTPGVRGKKKGSLTSRRFRCPTGPRKGRIVAKPETCNAPLNVKQSMTMKGTRRAKSGIHGKRSSFTKKYSPTSQRVKRANVSLKKRRGRLSKR